MVLVFMTSRQAIASNHVHQAHASTHPQQFLSMHIRTTKKMLIGASMCVSPPMFFALLLLKILDPLQSSQGMTNLYNKQAHKKPHSNWQPRTADLPTVSFMKQHYLDSTYPTPNQVLPLINAQAVEEGGVGGADGSLVWNSDISGGSCCGGGALRSGLGLGLGLGLVGSLFSPTNCANNLSKMTLFPSFAG
jgi:hypothetical protein